MNVYDIIPQKEDWKISKGIVYKKRLAWIPILNLKKDYIEVYFDSRMHKEILMLLPKIDQEFYLISPMFSNPKYSYTDIHKMNIENYLSNYAKLEFFNGFKKINFDIIENLIKYCKKFDCMLLIKESYEYINSKVQFEETDWYMQKRFYLFSEEIRDDFNSLYRQIKLQEIFY